MFWKKKFKEAIAERDKLRAECDTLMRARIQELEATCARQADEIGDIKKSREAIRDAKREAERELKRVKRELLEAEAAIEGLREQIDDVLLEYRHLCILAVRHGIAPESYANAHELCRHLNNKEGELIF